jgi:transcription initiation factor TFIIB
MATRDIYESGFDENVRTESSVKQCPECDGRVTTNAYKTLNEELGLPAEPVSPSMFVPCLTSDLECPDKIRRRARAPAEQAEQRDVTTGVHPVGFAAARPYKAGREEGRWLTQSEAADVANASKATARAHRDTLEELVA